MMRLTNDSTLIEFMRELIKALKRYDFMTSQEHLICCMKNSTGETTSP